MSNLDCLSVQMLLGKTIESSVGPTVLYTGALCMGQSTLGMQG